MEGLKLAQEGLIFNHTSLDVRVEDVTVTYLLSLVMATVM